MKNQITNIAKLYAILFQNGGKKIVVGLSRNTRVNGQ